MRVLTTSHVLFSKLALVAGLSFALNTTACARVSKPSATAMLADKIRLQNAEKKFGASVRAKEIVKANQDASVEFATKDVEVAPEGTTATTTGIYKLVEKDGQQKSGNYTARWKKLGHDWHVDTVDLADGLVPPPTEAVAN